jgi:hypothetical protein
MAPTRPVPTSRQWRRGRAVASPVNSRLGPNRDARDTIEARRRATSVDNHHDRGNYNRRDENRTRHHDDRGRGRRYNSDDDCDRSWSPKQRGPRAFGQGVRDARFPSRFRAPTDVPRYNETPTSAYGWRTTGSRATRGERQTTFSSSRTCRSTSGTPRGRGSSICPTTRSTTRPTCAGSLSETSKARTPTPTSSGSYATASSSQGRPVRVHPTLLQALHRTSRRDGQRRYLSVPERHDLHLPHASTRAPHAPNHAGAP